MVKVEEVTEKNARPYAASAASESTDSLSSVSSVASSQAPIESESLVERLSALVDIIPPEKRASIGRAAGWVKRGGKLLGNVFWVVTTSALLVGLPLALSLEDEAKIMQQEREMEGQRDGQAVRVPFHSLLVTPTDLDNLPGLRCWPTPRSIPRQPQHPDREDLCHQASRIPHRRSPCVLHQSRYSALHIMLIFLFALPTPQDADRY